MGKTAAGAVWLNAEQVSPYEYWQYWRNSEDADVERFLRLFTDLPLAEIEKLGQLQGADLNEAKVVLANEATRLCHGAEAAVSAAETARKTFADGTAGDDLPAINVEKDELVTGIPAFEIFRLAGLAASNGEARRLIKGGGGRLNNAVITDETRPITAADADSNGVIKLSAGKKRHALVRGV
jgi:tyrosyl-tRNA synthetase